MALFLWNYLAFEVNPVGVVSRKCLFGSSRRLSSLSHDKGHDRAAEVMQLKRRIAVLEMERDILKKAIGIFVEPKR